MSYVLVTGCNGFIGRKLSEALLNKGYRVLGLSSSEFRGSIHKNFKFIQLDLRESIKVKDIFEKYEISSVIHLAALAHLKNKKEISWNEYYRVNVLASKTIFNCAIKANANIFYASTVDVYGEVGSQLISEDQQPKPISDYAKSKYLAEKILMNLVIKNNVNYCVGRFATVYSRDFMKDVYKRVYFKFPSLAFIVNGGFDYHFVSVNNVIDFIISWLKNSNNTVGIYNVCDNKLINSKELIKLEKSVGNSKKVIKFSKKVLSFMNKLVYLLNKIIRNNKLTKINNNLYKLINPPKYSTEKIRKISSLRWDIYNTVYKD